MVGSEQELDVILAEAAGAAGSSDFGDDWFRRPLRAWLEDLAGPELNEFGRQFMRTLSVRDLVRRLRVLEALRSHPEIAEVPIPPIVYVTGLERSGTTLLHNLLGLHRDARVVRRWELMEPLPPPTTATYGTDPRIATVQSRIDRLRGSKLEQMHWVDAADPEECVWGFIDAVGMLGQAASACMPRWGRFISEEDLTPAFENYRRVLQLLLWKHPVGPDGFLVLKAPQISGQIAAFAAAFPEARFVITDRDPYRCMVSMAALAEAVVDPFCDNNPMTDDGHRMRLCQNSHTEKLTRIGSFTTAEPSRVVHLAYPDLVHRPIDTVQRVYGSRANVADALDQKVEDFLARQRAGGRATPPQTLGHMGYDHDEIWNDPVVAGYCDRFGVEREEARLTGAMTS